MRRALPSPKRPRPRLPDWLIFWGACALATALAHAQSLDFGDAPQTYPTLLSQNGARHTVVAGFYLGNLVDAESDGQPNSIATGDDTRPTGVPDDEDGVRFLTAPLGPGFAATVEVTASAKGQLDAWIDFNGDGDWADTGERVFTAVELAAGTNILNFNVPTGLTPTTNAFARFRLSSLGNLPFNGLAQDGEVEDYQLTIAEPLDFGDAPNSYHTLRANDGARHRVAQGRYLGNRVDLEVNGQPNPTATGDDSNPTAGPDDEDGVTFTSDIIPGLTATLTVTASLTSGLDAWVDFGRDGVFDDPADRIFTNRTVNAGANNLAFRVPAAAAPGQTFARFRLSDKGGFLPTGLADNGEVEDYQVTTVSALDFGDAPGSYQTKLAEDGPRHRFRNGWYLGNGIDLEPDGQPTSDALGDDTNPAAGPDDEDGVAFTSDLTPGLSATLTVTANVTGGLDAWVDFGRDGVFNDPADRIFTNRTVSAGANNLVFRVPGAAAPGPTFARFRLSEKGGLPPSGVADDGEVEDYQTTITSALDFGDAPISYKTRLAEDGPRHRLNADFYLGSSVDVEPDGQPSSDALGDDKNPAGGFDDEDGVVFTSPLIAGQTATLDVTATRQGQLDAWVDFGWDGFDDPTDRIFTNLTLNAGLNKLAFNLPGWAVAVDSYARFRFSQKGGLTPTGLADDGEVEDYRVTIQRYLDFGDAPYPPYPTLLGNNGARHRYNPSIFLGFALDAEQDGQPNADATGDDLNPAGGTDDEDGVTFSSLLRADGTATVNVRASARGVLNAWIDFGADGSWANAGDQIFTNLSLAAGPNSLTFNVPANATLGPTFARFRFNLQGSISYDGEANEGEVEDYEVVIEGPCERTNKGRDFWLTFPGNYAPDPANPLRLSLCIVGPRNTSGKVEIPGLGWVTNFIIGAELKAKIYLPKEADLGDANDRVQTNGIHVTASAEVAVFGLSRVYYTTDGYLGLPSDVIGTDYLIQSFANQHSGVPSLNGTQFGLVACQDDTTVTITPSVGTTGHTAGVAYSVTLQQGQTYQLRNTNNAPRDLSGTWIAADKPIAVFGSHHCATIPDGTVWFCDYLVEQLLPLERASTNFVTMPLATRTAPDTFRFFAVDDNTRVFINGFLVATLGRGKFHQASIGSPAYVTSEGRLLAVQYANSSDRDWVTNSDPFQLVVPPTDMFRTQYEICVPDSGFVTNFVNVIIPSAALGMARLDGNPIPIASFVPILGSGYHGAQVGVSPGAHFLTAMGAAGGAVPFGVVVYGWAQYDSYGYPGGMFFTDKTPPTVTCLTNLVAIVAGLPSGDPCRAFVPDLRGLVTFTDNCGLSTNNYPFQTPPPGTVVYTGDHAVVLSVSDEAGNTGRCVLTLRVLDETEPTITCPTNLVVNARSREGAVVNFVVTAKTDCGTTLPVTSTPPSGSLFPPGITTVNCGVTNWNGTYDTCSFSITVRHLSASPGTVSGTIVLRWSGGGVLQTAPSLDGPSPGWTDLSNATSPFTFSTSGSQRFFRIRYP